jgi:hypothetical protein
MTIKQTAAAIRQNAIDIRNCTNAVRLVRLSDKRWDLTAGKVRYAAAPCWTRSHLTKGASAPPPTTGEKT